MLINRFPRNAPVHQISSSMPEGTHPVNLYHVSCSTWHQINVQLYIDKQFGPFLALEVEGDVLCHFQLLVIVFAAKAS